MGRGKHCSPDERRLIRKLRYEGKTFKEISEIMNCSQNMITNALKHVNNSETRGRKRKTSERDDRRILKLVKQDAFITSTAIKQDLQLQVTTRTIRNRLIDSNYRARAARKAPFVSESNRKRRLVFAKYHMENLKQHGAGFFRNVLWSDETKINLFGADSRHYVRRPRNSEFSPQYTKKTIKHGGGCIMIWGCFSWYGVGPLFWIKPTMTQNEYLGILDEVMLPYAEEDMPLKWKYQQDNDPKHTSKKVKQWFVEKKIDVLDWPAQSPDLNPIENLWNQVKRNIANKKHRNQDELWNAIQKAWYAIPVEMCRKLVDSMQRRCEAVLKSKGFPTKY